MWTGDCAPLCRQDNEEGSMRSGPNLAVSLAVLLFLNLSSFAQRGGGNPQALGVYKSQINPNWFQNNSRFWYRNDLSGGRKEFILVDAVAGSRQGAFDHQKLAAALSKAAGIQSDPLRLPFNTIDFIDDGNAIRFSASDVWWKCDLRSYECTKTTAAPAQPATQSARLASERFRQARAARGNRSPRSGDGKWTALVKDHNVFVRNER